MRLIVAVLGGMDSSTAFFRSHFQEIFRSKIPEFLVFHFFLGLVIRLYRRSLGEEEKVFLIFLYIRGLGFHGGGMLRDITIVATGDIA